MICPHCGEDTNRINMTGNCTVCGTGINDGSPFCNLCWSARQPSQSAAKPSWDCMACLRPMPPDRRTNYCARCDAILNPVAEAEVDEAVTELQQWVS